MQLNQEIQLNSEQSAVRSLAAKDPCNIVVLALAGTGKTTMLLHTAKVLDGSKFICAFGANAVIDLKARASDLDLHADIMTSNSFGMQTWLRANGWPKIPIERNKIRLIIDDIKAKVPLAGKYFAFLCKLVSYAKKAGFGVLREKGNHKNWLGLMDHYGIGREFMGEPTLVLDLIGIAIRLYDLSLDRCDRQMDYDDQLLAPAYYKSRFQKYANVLLDEAQDTSALRLYCIMSAVTSDGRFIAVGDNHQSIMGFTGATNDSMKEIQEMTDAIVMPLSTSYRLPLSAEPHVQKLVPGIKAAPTNKVGKWLTTNLQPEEGSRDTGFFGFYPFTANDAILCRVTRPLVDLAYVMIRSGIACRVEGKDIGSGLVSLARRFNDTYVDIMQPKLYSYMVKETATLRAKYMDMEADSLEDRCRTVLSICSAMVADETSRTRISNFVDKVNSIFGDTKDGVPPEMCTLSTVHKAKGREWQRVFVLGLDEYMPSPRAKSKWEVEQELNLKYVAETRHLDTFVHVVMERKRDKAARP